MNQGRLRVMVVMVGGWLCNVLACPGNRALFGILGVRKQTLANEVPTAENHNGQKLHAILLEGYDYCA